MGLAKSPSPKPTARSMARFGARSAPAVTSWLRRLSLMGPPGWRAMIPRLSGSRPLVTDPPPHPSPRRGSSLHLDLHLARERDVVGQVAHVFLVPEGHDDGHHRVAALVGQGVPHVETHAGLPVTFQPVPRGLRGELVALDLSVRP